MKTNVQSTKPSIPKFQPNKVVDAPFQAKLQPASVAGYRGITNGPLKGLIKVGMGGTVPLAERHTRRCMENRRRKETGYRLGVDY